MMVIKRATDLMNTHILIFCTHRYWSSEHTHTDLIKHILIWAHTDLTNNEHVPTFWTPTFWVPTFWTHICRVFWLNTHTSLPNTDLNKHKTYFENTHIRTYVSSEKTLAYLFGWIHIQSNIPHTKKTQPTHIFWIWPQRPVCKCCPSVPLCKLNYWISPQLCVYV